MGPESDRTEALSEEEERHRNTPSWKDIGSVSASPGDASQENSSSALLISDSRPERKYAPIDEAAQAMVFCYGGQN